jgi:hypothetical protein
MSAAPDDQAVATRGSPCTQHPHDLPLDPREDGLPYVRVEQHRTIIAGVIRQTATTISRSRAMKFAAMPEFHNYTARTDRLFRQPGRKSAVFSHWPAAAGPPLPLGPSEAAVAVQALLRLLRWL